MIETKARQLGDTFTKRDNLEDINYWYVSFYFYVSTPNP